MARPVDRPLARAQDHLRAGRIPNAIGAFRAAIGIDPDALDAHLGLASALHARGDATIAADGLVSVAEQLAEEDRDTEAMRVYARALAIDPTRYELHLDVAVLEWGMGRAEAATARAESLAEIYMRHGRTEEAVEVLRFFASLTDDVDEIDEIEEIETIEPTSSCASTETVVATTVLIRPDGSLYVGPRSMGAAVSKSTIEPDTEMTTMVSRRPAAPARVQVSMPPVIAAAPRKPSVPSPAAPSKVRTLPPRQPQAPQSSSGKLRLPRSPRPAVQPSSVATLPPQPIAVQVQARAKQAPKGATLPALRRVPPAPVRVVASPAAAVPRQTPKAATEQIRSRSIITSAAATDRPRLAKAPAPATTKSAAVPPAKRAAVSSPSVVSAAVPPAKRVVISSPSVVSTAPRPARAPRTSSRPLTPRSEVLRSSKSETAPITVRREGFGASRSPLAQRLLSRAHSQRPATARSGTPPTPAPNPATPPPLSEDEITGCFRRSELLS